MVAVKSLRGSNELSALSEAAVDMKVGSISPADGASGTWTQCASLLSAAGDVTVMRILSVNKRSVAVARVLLIIAEVDFEGAGKGAGWPCGNGVVILASRTWPCDRCRLPGILSEKTDLL